ncbi:hypothetical protein FIBSPDRAFT_877350 [Athelia psychrophila]|uniref:Uncharacterized protein n=1 Tax=Athelia psychrophila TaxID=1759441 RepID=A0A167W312_9AGAM|nr:hypothetical protein FIBSPDRAFT_877350 [Fibularhizoctonia sp. CBS 109695]
MTDCGDGSKRLDVFAVAGEDDMGAESSSIDPNLVVKNDLPPDEQAMAVGEEVSLRSRIAILIPERSPAQRTRLSLRTALLPVPTGWDILGE